MQMGHVGFNCHTFFLCVHLAGGLPVVPCAHLQQLGLINASFFGRSCKDPHRIFGHIGQDKRAIPLLLSLC